MSGGGAGADGSRAVVARVWTGTRAGDMLIVCASGWAHQVYDHAPSRRGDMSGGGAGAEGNPGGGHAHCSRQRLGASGLCPCPVPRGDMSGGGAGADGSPGGGTGATGQFLSQLVARSWRDSRTTPVGGNPATSGRLEVSK
ncbi:hypothetical protein ABIB26_002328 [Arthrobacter sp. UYEF20]